MHQERNHNSLCAQLLSHVRLFVTPWTIAHQAHLSMGFSRQEYWSGFAQRFTGYKVFHIHHLINSSQQPCEVGRAGSSVSIYTDVEAEAQRGLMTCSRPHSKLAIELGPELGLGARLSPLTAVSSRGPQPLSRVSATPEPGPPAPWQ